MERVRIGGRLKCVIVTASALFVCVLMKVTRAHLLVESRASWLCWLLNAKHKYDNYCLTSHVNVNTIMFTC